MSIPLQEKKIGVVKRICLIIILITRLGISIPDAPGSLNNYTDGEGKNG